MKKIQEIVFWQPNVSHHNIAMICQLVQYYNSITLCVLERMSERRLAMGWKEPNTIGINVELIPAKNPEALFDQLNHTGVVHVFSGTRGYKTIWKVFKRAISVKANCGFQAETRNWRGLSGVIRYFQSVLEAVHIKNRISFILGIGDLGVAWYRRVGYPSAKIFDWAYFTSSSSAIMTEDIASDAVRFVYVGRLSPEKGIIQLVDELRSIVGDWELHIIGTGSLEKEVKQMTTGDRRFNLRGILPLEQVSVELATMDYLILPSTGKDGWGAVVNEALQQGVPCIVSRNAGASCLINSKMTGWVFDPEKTGQLHRILQMIITKNLKPDDQQRSALKAYAKVCSAESGALYMKDIISFIFEGKGSRPKADWKKITLDS